MYIHVVLIPKHDSRSSQYFVPAFKQPQSPSLQHLPSLVSFVTDAAPALPAHAGGGKEAGDLPTAPPAPPPLSPPPSPLHPPPPPDLAGAAALFSPYAGPASPRTEEYQPFPLLPTSVHPGVSRKWKVMVGELLQLPPANAVELATSGGAWLGAPAGIWAVSAATAAYAAAAEPPALCADHMGPD